MKYLYLFIFLIFGNILQASDYECAMSGIQYFPEKREISLNPMFIIEGYAFSQKHIEALKNRKVYLESAKGEEILLELQEILKGQMQLTQAILRPVSSLSPDSRYYLRLSAATSEDQLKDFGERYNSEKKEREPIFWETGKMEHCPPPKDNLRINFEQTRVEFYGCGPAAYAIFTVSGKGEDQIWYKTEMEDLATGIRTVYYIREWKDKLQVGHGMCSGAFTYEKEGKYKVRFTPMNLDGIPIKTTSWIAFESPYKNAENPWGF